MNVYRAFFLVCIPVPMPISKGESQTLDNQIIIPEQNVLF